jgi:hypothetical protein
MPVSRPSACNVPGSVTRAVGGSGFFQFFFSASRVKAQDRWTILLHVIERAGRPGNAQGATAGVFAEGGDLSMLTAEIGKNDEDPPDR